jgi:hypothetical protein
VFFFSLFSFFRFCLRHGALVRFPVRQLRFTGSTFYSLPSSYFSVRNLGTLTVRAEAKADTRDLFCVTFGANNLVNKEGFFSKSDPFIVILRCNEDSSYSRVWESSKVMNSLNPRWGQTKIPLSTLCNGDIHRPLRIEIYDWERSGKHVFMGQVAELSVARLLENKNMRLDVIEPEKQKKKSYVNSGVLTADDCDVEKHYSFTQYIQGKTFFSSVSGNFSYCLFSDFCSSDSSRLTSTSSDF